MIGGFKRCIQPPRLCDCVTAPRSVTRLQSNGAEVYDEQSRAELNTNYVGQKKRYIFCRIFCFLVFQKDREGAKNEERRFVKKKKKKRTKERTEENCLK